MFASTLTALSIFIAVLLGVFSFQKFGLKEDNQVEEIAEEVIESATGIDVDLSPGSPEEDDDPCICTFCVDPQ